MKINEDRTKAGFRLYWPETFWTVTFYAISNVAANKHPLPSQRKVMIVINAGAIMNFYGIYFLTDKNQISHDMTKPTKWLCAQGRLRSAWASAQSDQSLRCPYEESLGP